MTDYTGEEPLVQMTAQAVTVRGVTVEMAKSGDRWVLTPPTVAVPLLGKADLSCPDSAAALAAAEDLAQIVANFQDALHRWRERDRVAVETAGMVFAVEAPSP